MSQKDAMTMPLTAGAVLVGLYVSFKFLPADAINLALRLYFFVLGTVAVGSMAGWVLEALGKATGVVKRASRVLELPFGMGGVNAFGILGLVIGAAVAGLEAYAKLSGQPWHWLLNNAVGACFCFEALGRLSLGRVSTGMLLLVRRRPALAVLPLAPPLHTILDCGCRRNHNDARNRIAHGTHAETVWSTRWSAPGRWQRTRPPPTSLEATSSQLGSAAAGRTQETPEPCSA